MTSLRARLLTELKLTPIVQVACKKANVGRATYYRWRKDPDFAAAADEALEHSSALINDMAESQLISAIKDKNMTAIIFWLKNHHKVYAPRIEVDGHLTMENYQLSPEQQELVKRALTQSALLLESSKEENNEKPI